MTNTQKNYNLISIVITLIVIITQGYLTLHYFDVKFGLSGTSSICNISSYLNCDKVTLSPFSTLIGAPIAAFGLSLHIILFIILCIQKFSFTSNSEKAGRWGLIIAAISAIASVIMAIISFGFIGALCLFCVLCYVLSIVLLFTIYKSNEEASMIDEVKETLSAGTPKWPLVYLALIPALALFGNFTYTKNLGIDKLKKSVNEFSANWESAPTLSFSNAGVVHGSQNPKMTIVEFADFLCPHCKVASNTFNSFINNHPDVQIVFKPYPLDGSCNSGIERKGDGNRCLLAKASLCGEELYQNGWLVAKEIFKKQESLAQMGDVSLELSKIYTDLKMDESKMKECLTSEKTHTLLMSLTAEGQAAKIQGTPAIFVNNRELEGGQFTPVLQSIFDKLTR